MKIYFLGNYRSFEKLFMFRIVLSIDEILNMKGWKTHPTIAAKNLSFSPNCALILVPNIVSVNKLKTKYIIMIIIIIKFIIIL